MKFIAKVLLEFEFEAIDEDTAVDVAFSCFNSPDEKVKVLNISEVRIIK